MSQPLFNYSVQSLMVGSKVPYDGPFESLVTQPLQGVQSANVALSYPRLDTFTWNGEGSPTFINRPRADITFSYLVTSGANERALGFIMDQTAPALYNMNDERNYYLIANTDGQDMIGYQGHNSFVFALGNGVINRYELSAAVGQLTTASVTLEGLNLLIQSGGSGQTLPAIEKVSGAAATGTYVLPIVTEPDTNFFECSPVAIQLTFDSGCAMGAQLSGHGQNTCILQSFSYTIDMPRQSVQNIGWAYPINRPIHWPITIGIRARAVMNGYQTDALNRFFYADSGFNFTVGLQNAYRGPMDYVTTFTAAKLDSQSTVGRIGALNEIDLNWSLKIYDINRAGPTDQNFYVVGSGIPYTQIVFPQVSFGTGVGQSPLIITFTGSPSYLDVVNGPGFLSGNAAYVPDSPSTTDFRLSVVGQAESEDIVVTVS